MPSIIFLCAIGAYAVNNRVVDVWYVIVFGVVGYVFKKLEYPLAPMVLALVLGDLAETAMRQSLIMSQGSLSIFFASPIAAAVNGLAILFFLLPAVRAVRSWLRPAPTTPTPQLQDAPAADR
jgi:putative tricarboxylic transport membrane protein